LLELDLTLGPLRFRFTLTTPSEDTTSEYLAEIELADDDTDVPVGFHGK
jgi:hypothetical protein